MTSFVNECDILSQEQDSWSSAKCKQINYQFHRTGGNSLRPVVNIVHKVIYVFLQTNFTEVLKIFFWLF